MFKLRFLLLWSPLILSTFYFIFLLIATNSKQEISFLNWDSTIFVFLSSIFTFSFIYYGILFFIILFAPAKSLLWVPVICFSLIGGAKFYDFLVPPKAGLIRLGLFDLYLLPGSLLSGAVQKLSIKSFLIDYQNCSLADLLDSRTRANFTIESAVTIQNKPVLLFNSYENWTGTRAFVIEKNKSQFTSTHFNLNSRIDFPVIWSDFQSIDEFKAYHQALYELSQERQSKGDSIQKVWFIRNEIGRVQVFIWIQKSKYTDDLNAIHTQLLYTDRLLEKRDIETLFSQKSETKAVEVNFAGPQLLFNSKQERILFYAVTDDQYDNQRPSFFLAYLQRRKGHWNLEKIIEKNRSQSSVPMGIGILKDQVYWLFDDYLQNKIGLTKIPLTVKIESDDRPKFDFSFPVVRNVNGIQNVTILEINSQNALAHFGYQGFLMLKWQEDQLIEDSVFKNNFYSTTIRAKNPEKIEQDWSNDHELVLYSPTISFPWYITFNSKTISILDLAGVNVNGSEIF